MKKKHKNKLWSFYFFLFFLITNILLINMITGLLVERYMHNKKKDSLKNFYFLKKELILIKFSNEIKLN